MINKRDLELLKEAQQVLTAENASRDVQEAINGPCRLWLDTWVRPLIEKVIENGERQHAKLKR